MAGARVAARASTLLHASVRLAAEHGRRQVGCGAAGRGVKSWALTDGVELLDKLRGGAAASLCSSGHLERTEQVDGIHERRRRERSCRDGRQLLEISHISY